MRDRILLGCMALQGCRSIEMYRANLGDISESYGQHYLKLDGKNSIRTVILRPDLGAEIAQYRQARRSTKEKLTAESPLFIPYPIVVTVNVYREGESVMLSIAIYLSVT